MFLKSFGSPQAREEFCLTPFTTLYALYGFLSRFFLQFDLRARRMALLDMTAVQQRMPQFESNCGPARRPEAQ
jgi:hypothetical protein